MLLKHYHRYRYINSCYELIYSSYLKRLCFGRLKPGEEYFFEVEDFIEINDDLWGEKFNVLD